MCYMRFQTRDRSSMLELDNTSSSRGGSARSAVDRGGQAFAVGRFRCPCACSRAPSRRAHRVWWPAMRISRRPLSPLSPVHLRTPPVNRNTIRSHTPARFREPFCSNKVAFTGCQAISGFHREGPASLLSAKRNSSYCGRKTGKPP